MEIGAESLLALRQAVDARLTNESIEKITGKSDAPTDEILAKLNTDGIIDEIIGALRGLPLAQDNRPVKSELDLAKRHLLVSGLVRLSLNPSFYCVISVLFFTHYSYRRRWFYSAKK